MLKTLFHVTTKCHLEALSKIEVVLSLYEIKITKYIPCSSSHFFWKMSTAKSCKCQKLNLAGLPSHKMANYVDLSALFAIKIHMYTYKLYTCFSYSL